MHNNQTHLITNWMTTVGEAVEYRQLFGGCVPSRVQFLIILYIGTEKKDV